MKKYNILFIITDQQRKDTLGCYGNQLIQTPHIDKLASEGIVFDKAYCESPICMPSRATLHTGKKAAHHGVTHHNDSMRPDEKTLAHVLAEDGYVTKCIGKMHLTSQQHRGREESIADWRDGLYEEWNGPYYGYQTAELILGHSNSLVGHYGNWLRENYPEERHRFVVENMEKLPVSSGQGVYNNDIPESLHSSSFVGDRTVKFLQDMKETGEPFFCFASFPDPHWPIMPPKAYYEMYDDVAMPPQTPENGEAEKDNYPRQFMKLKRDKQNAYDGGGHYVNDPSEIEAIMRPYWGAVSWIDVNVGKILHTLKELKMEEDTIVIYTTDHGEYMGAHGMMAKGGFVWEEFINVPLIVRCPDLIPGGRRTDALLSFIDMVPTLLDLLGVNPSPLAPDGISQKTVLTGASETLRNNLTVTHFGKGDTSKNPDIHSLITPEWKLNYYAGDDNGELYHLNEDPRELNNLYHAPEVANVQRELIGKLLDELILVNDKSYEHRIKNADHYGKHVMHYDEWKSELERV